MISHLETWNRWSYRDFVARAIARTGEAGDAHNAAVLRHVLADEPEVDPLDALAANNELVRLLSGWQWHAIRAARESSTSWDRIAGVLGTTAEQARADYLDHIERAEKYQPGLTDTASYRAVLDDEPIDQVNSVARPDYATSTSRRRARR